MRAIVFPAEQFQRGQYFRPAWPRVPWSNGRYRLPMRGEDVEIAAALVDELWSLDGLSDPDRRQLLRAARNLETLNCGIAPLSGEDLSSIYTTIQKVEGRRSARN
jgi:hypothetical protein